MQKTQGYCGADIEGVVQDSIEQVFTSKRDSLTTQDLLEALNGTHPLSEIMKDALNNMMKFYKENKFKNASRQKGTA